MSILGHKYVKAGSKVYKRSADPTPQETYTWEGEEINITKGDFLGVLRKVSRPAKPQPQKEK